LISDDNIEETWNMNVEWCKRNDCKRSSSLRKEYCAVARCFENYRALELEGGIIRAGGKIVAFTIGEKLNPNTYVIHIEKAFSDIQGAYQMINREFAAYIKEKYPEIVYVNREEDMGDEGLRKAKLSYYPVRMEVKSLATYVGGRS